ncbi:sunset domain-containing protein [Arthrobacter sp. D1-17]
MEWIVWVIVIVVIIAVVWWLLNRNSGKGGTPEAAGTSQVTSTSPSGTEATAPSPSEPAAVPSGANAAFPSGSGTTEQQPAPLAGETPARQGSSAAGHISPEDQEPDIESWDAATPRPGAGTSGATGGDVDDWNDEEDQAEWETQWSETGAEHHTGTGPAAASRPAEPFPSAGTATPPASAATPAAPAHHAEYTAPHAPTLPGAESAAADAFDADAETRQRMQSSAATEEGASHDAEPVGHQESSGTGEQPAFGGQAGSQPAADAMAGQPYGDGSAAPAADGSGPDGYTVKADTGSMTYYDEDNPGYADVRAEVWFLSPAHAEAAGFRAPRRTRR